MKVGFNLRHKLNFNTNKVYKTAYRNCKPFYILNILFKFNI